jgi:hypothetical protein
MRHDMMELEEAVFGTAAAMAADEGAAAAVAQPDRAFHGGGDMPRPRSRAAASARVVRSGELLPGQDV